MSYTSVILPILSVLNVAQDVELGRAHTWRATNKQQEILVERYLPKTGELNLLSKEELSSCASKNTAIVNRFLKEKGFDIQLSENNGEVGGLAVASVLDIALQWKEEGEKTTLEVEGTTYPAVSFENGYRVDSTSEGKEIISLDCKNGDTVYLAVADEPQEGFELLDTIQKLMVEQKTDVSKKYAGLIFPMVELNQMVDITWLIGIRYEGWKVEQALQQTNFVMNEKGAHAQSAAAIHTMCTNAPCIIPKPTLTIDKPFYLWIERPGMSLPLFAGYIDFEDWKEPQSIE